MFRMLCLLAPLLAVSCVMRLPERESLALWENADASKGRFVNWGATALRQFTVFDQAGRPVLRMKYFPAAETPLSPLAVSRLRSPAILDWAFPPGYYRAEFIPYYFTWTVLGGWRRVDLPRGSTSFYVGRELNADYDPIAGRHIGWFVSLNGGDIPPW